MAYLEQFTCTTCAKDKREITSGQQYPYSCLDCRIAKAKIDKTAAMNKLQFMPIESRIENIEEQLYDLNTNARLNALESRFHTYG